MSRQDYSHKARNAGRGLCCTKCGTKLEKADRTYPLPGKVQRDRRCKNRQCGAINLTEEVVLKPREIRPSYPDTNNLDNSERP